MSLLVSDPSTPSARPCRKGQAHWAVHHKAGEGEGSVQEGMALVARSHELCSGKVELGLHVQGQELYLVGDLQPLWRLLVLHDQNFPSCHRRQVVEEAAIPQP